jgi:ribosomal protein S27AE
MADRKVDLLTADYLIPTPRWLRVLPPNPAPVCPLCSAVPFLAGELFAEWEWSCSRCGHRYWTPRLP